MGDMGIAAVSPTTSLENFTASTGSSVLDVPRVKSLKMTLQPYIHNRAVSERITSRPNCPGVKDTAEGCIVVKNCA